jgi:hypothetical protein
MDNISITLSIQGWNVVFNALRQRPYGEIVELIEEIKRQADHQLNPKSNTPVAEPTGE